MKANAEVSRSYIKGQNANSFLCLIKRRNEYPIRLNGCGKAPGILKFWTMGGCIVSFMIWPLYCQRRKLLYILSDSFKG